MTRRLAMTVPNPAESYRSYRDLPPLAGLGSIADAANVGLSVEACVARHKRYHYVFRRLHEIFTARITAEPIYELKTAFAHHAVLCAEHVACNHAPGSARCANLRWGWKPCRTRLWSSFSTRFARRRRRRNYSSACMKRRCRPSTQRWLGTSRIRIH